MKRIKNLMIAAMVMFAGNAMAQKLSAEAVTIEPGGETDLTVNYESEQDLTAAQFTIALPEGISIKKNKKKYAATLFSHRMPYGWLRQHRSGRRTRGRTEPSSFQDPETARHRIRHLKHGSRDFHSTVWPVY